MRSGEYIHAEVRGQLSQALGTGGEHTGFQIRANGMTWEVDASASTTLLKMADLLEGKRVIASGTYAQRTSESRVRRVFAVAALKLDASKGRGESIDVTVHGTLRTGVMAIGAETTGATITSGAVTWDLELDGKQLKVASELNAGKVIISGRLRPAGGVEVKNRFIVKVRSIKAVHWENRSFLPSESVPSPKGPRVLQTR